MIAESELIEQRPHLVSVAYRLLGDAGEAEDAVQEAMLRATRDNADEVRSPRAYLTTIVTRLCLDRLKSAQMRRETYVGPWLPEPVRTDRGDLFMSVEPRDTKAISMAFLVVLETLSPLERAAFLLHEVFDYTHAEVGEMIGRDVAATRQLVHRARVRVDDGQPRYAPNAEAHERVLMAFLHAITTGDVDAVAQLLTGDVTARSDGGGKVVAARTPISGAGAVARFFVGTYRNFGGGLAPEIALINGWPALILRTENGRAQSVLSIETDGTLVRAAYTTLNPDKLGHV